MSEPTTFCLYCDKHGHSSEDSHGNRDQRAGCPCSCTGRTAVMTPEQKAVVDRIMNAVASLVDVERRHCIGKAGAFDIKEAKAALSTAIEQLALQAAEARALAVAQAFTRGHDAGWASAKADSAAASQPLVPAEMLAASEAGHLRKVN